MRASPGFPATLHWTQPRVRFSVGENRMKSVNANKINRKSGKAEGSAVCVDGETEPGGHPPTADTLRPRGILQIPRLRSG
jgi:hypothetical protein